jgi:hypothetical protein
MTTSGTIIVIIVGAIVHIILILRLITIGTIITVGIVIITHIVQELSWLTLKQIRWFITGYEILT